MKHNRLVAQMVYLAVVVLLSAACTTSQLTPAPVSPTATPMPPTATSVPPTNTPVPPTPTVTPIPPTATATLMPTATPILGPSPRGYVSLAYDTESDRVILWGGLTGNIDIPANSSRETWSYDVAANQWTLMKPATGPKGGAPSLAYDIESDRVILFGAIPFGENWKTSDMSQTWAYDYNTDSWTKMADGPAKHLGARIAYDAQSDRVILFGGLNASSYVVYDDTWAYDFNSDTWTEMKPSTNPPGTNYQAMAYDSKADRVLMYGGSDIKGKFLFSVWAYNFNTNTWQEMVPGEQPSPGNREYPVMVYDAESDRTILFGGDYDYIKEGEVWTYEYSTNTWIKLDSSLGPGDRSRHGMAYSSAADRVILFGGQVDDTQFNYTNETWTYDPNTNTWTDMTSQP